MIHRQYSSRCGEYEDVFCRTVSSQHVRCAMPWPGRCEARVCVCVLKGGGLPFDQNSNEACERFMTVSD